jgi:hypothetical protein
VVNPGASGAASVANQGDWVLVLYATSQMSEYPATPDYVKDTERLTLECGAKGTLTVSYNWQGHPSKYWWVALRRNGAVVYTSPYIVKP